MIPLPLIQGSAEWIDARLCLPTASQFHRILTPAKAQLAAGRFSYRNELLAEWALGYPVVDAESNFMTRGKDMEEDARAWYELQREEDVSPGGFLLTDDGRAGCSPDGLCGEAGLIEIKIPGAKGHIGFLLDGLEGEHRCQVQGELWISGRQWCDVVIYSPAFPSRIYRLERDEEFIGKLRQAVTQFAEELDAGKRMLEGLGIRPALQRPERVRGLALVG